MSSVKGAAETCPTWMGCRCQSCFRGVRALILALLVALAGCASSDRPPIVVPDSTWRRVDGDIVNASHAATGQATDYAHDAMTAWKALVYQRTDTDFIPWFSSYWTRQWLTMKVTWYRLNAGGEREPTVNRLAAYLQEKYQDRVLEPVAEQIDPDVLMQQAMTRYVQHLDAQLQGIPLRYGVPLEQFDQHLKGIPAIALGPAHSASLYQIVHADPFDELPAYAALVERIRNTPDGSALWSSHAGISSMAKRTSETLEAELATSSAASVAGAVVGRVAGSVLSLGVAAFNAIARENERAQVEAQLRHNLSAALEQEWLAMLRNPDSGVLAGVYHLAGQIEGRLAAGGTRPITFESPQPGVRFIHGGKNAYDAPGDYWDADQ
ncbi:MAG TPA: hypothetical protein VJA19_07025 [Pseudomonas sp.]|nr:hypothetical protein [Pseudomonas sp.]